MQHTENIDYFMAQSYFDEAERRGLKLYLGNFDTNLWLHKENINLDKVIEVAKKFTDSRITIISEGVNKGFYIYSKLKKNCVKLSSTSFAIHQAQLV